MNSSQEFRKMMERLSRSAVGLLLLAALLIAVPPTEAGFFKDLVAKRKAKMQRAAEAAKPKETPKPKPIPRHRSYYRDAHKDAYINEELLAGAGEDVERKVVIDISRQRAYLIIHDLIAIDSAVSTARRGKYTPRGTYRISEKIRSGKVSTLYHVYMPNWMRLSETPVGMHTGDLPGYPASAGCIRLPQSVAPILFQHVSRGVTVEVVDSWNEEELIVPYSLPMREPMLLGLL